MAVEWDKEHASGDAFMDHIERVAEKAAPAHEMDSDEARAEHRRLMSWFYFEREKQSENRMEMALDADFYDGLQWDEQDAVILRNRGQLPLVYNEIAPMVDWVTGTERRVRVDWDVLPRTEDDVESAGNKRKLLKYISDVNRTEFVRSQAFEDAIKVGVGWLDDGARDDPTEEVLYSKYESWRNVLWDSNAYELDLKDARYVIRWRWVDQDVALAMFPERKDAIMRATEDVGAGDTEGDDEEFYLNERLGSAGSEALGIGLRHGQASTASETRKRVRLIEIQYKKPVMSRVVTEGPFAGAFVHDMDGVLQSHLERDPSGIVDRVMMRTHIAIMTDNAMLHYGPSIYRHNRFTLTPIWCYRRDRDRLPYGLVRRVRDIQLDMNKRASKALFMLNTRQVIAENGAVDDVNLARDEIDQPDGWVTVNPGKELRIERDSESANGQLNMMSLAAQKIQTSGGVTDEAMGRQTNAVSGSAIEKRQSQSSVVLTKPFDNKRLAVQVSGEKQLANCEQFYTEQKVVRLTGAKNKIEWLKLNEPEQQPDGSVRFLNDITASQSDFLVAEADYAGTLRQVMFDSINNLAQRLPPEIAIKLFIAAMEFSDLPNHEELAEEMRRAIGERDPDKEMTPEEQQQAEQQAAMQAESLELQRQGAIAALEEQRAKVRKINAEADKLAAESGVSPEQQDAVMQVRAQADQALQQMAAKLQKLELELANRTLQIGRETDAKMAVAQIDADTKLRIAELNATAERQLAMLEAKLAAASDRHRDDGEAPRQKSAGQGETPRTQPTQSPQVINIHTGSGRRKIHINRDEAGQIAGADVIEEQEAQEQ